MKKINIGIIGGGACGVAALAELMVQLKIANLHRQVSITLIEREDAVGPGLAFGTKQPGHLLNTQADLMGIHSFEPDHFAIWLKNCKPEVDHEVKGGEQLDEAYTTRRLYGEYLKEQLNHYLEEASQIQLEVRIVHGEASNLHQQDNGWDIQLEDRTILSADHVLLAPGTPKPNNFPEFESLNRYFSSPWPSEPILAGIPKHANVGILGSSLSSIDAVMTLIDNGYKGKIRLYSLDGLMPRVQPLADYTYKREFLTLSRVHRIRRTKWRQPTVIEIFRLFKEEAENYTGSKIDWKSTERTGIPAEELLAKDIRVAEKGGDAFINILYDLRYEASQIWDWLSVEEKIRFKKWFGPYWTVNRYGMPLVNAKRLKNLFAAGRLEVNAPLKDVVYDRNAQQFVFSYGADQTDRNDYLINATGPATDISKMKSTLVQNLTKNKIIEAYPVGGICIHPELMEVISSRKKIKNLYAVGHICNGMLLDVNAVWFNVRCIAKLTSHITHKIKNGSFS